MSNARDPKVKALREDGALNTRPVEDELFRDSEFFDPRDLVQVKYEMLRKVHKDGQSVSRVTEAFGFSRPTFYKAQADFEQEGVVGLIPQKRGPRSRHKLTDEVLDFVESVRAEAKVSVAEIVEQVEVHFGLRVHRRSLERALSRRGKKTPRI